jgi:hypothetical protein
MIVAELPPWRRGSDDPEPDEPDEPARPARELPPWPDWTPPPPPPPARAPERPPMTRDERIVAWLIVGSFVIAPLVLGVLAYLYYALFG